MTKVSFRLADSEKEQLAALADSQDLSMSQLLRWIVKKYLV